MALILRLLRFFRRSESLAEHYVVYEITPAISWHVDQDPDSPTYGRSWVTAEQDGITATSSRSAAEALRNLRRKQARRA